MSNSQAWCLTNGDAGSVTHRTIGLGICSCARRAIAHGGIELPAEELRNVVVSLRETIFRLSSQVPLPDRGLPIVYV